MLKTFPHAHGRRMMMKKLMNGMQHMPLDCKEAPCDAYLTSFYRIICRCVCNQWLCKAHAAEDCSQVQLKLMFPV